MQLNLRQPPVIVGENGHIPMSDGDTDWTVVVTREALESIASPPDASLDRLMDYADVYARIAGNKLEFGRDRDRNRIWVMEEDVAVWLASEAFRISAWKRRHQAPLASGSKFSMRASRH
ncbi:hypothetical protein [Rhizobium tubonense]|uniref:Uncharacterized protein n=1 Tax=Rhizobium tubonense TaxID=484088 RepID=A0A2W4EFQ0_9HYPH|nr:hypothetical protein [Rhizobium tubonense]PZM10050.1 hypothetical protein CPY51_24115 [Rhizobium tubonense]